MQRSSQLVAKRVFGEIERRLQGAAHVIIGERSILTANYRLNILPQVVLCTVLRVSAEITINAHRAKQTFDILIF